MPRVREGTRSEDVAEVAKRLGPYIDRPCGEDPPDSDDGVSPMLDEAQERAATLLAVMPPRQHRVTIEQLVSPEDPEQGRQVVDALIEGAFVAEDERGCLR